jgi:hypothetical protein
MPFQKGRERTGGIKKGQKQQRTLLWDQLGDYLATQGADRFMKYLMNIVDDKEFAEKFTDIVEFFKPKQRRVDNVGGGDINIIVNRNVPD